jgi:hypothetical protein
MLILYDDALPQLNPYELNSKMDELGIKHNSRKCHVNQNAISLSKLNPLKSLVYDKILLITCKTIESNEMMTSLATYNGLVEAIGGDLGMVTINDNNSKKWVSLCLHEILHLHGVPHCETNGCIMSFKLCHGTFRYCLDCSVPCYTLDVCDVCRGDINV